MSQNVSKILPKTSQDRPRWSQDLPRSDQDAYLDAIIDHLGPNLEASWSQLRTFVTQLRLKFCPHRGDHARKNPKTPPDHDFPQILDPSRPRFSIMLGTFCKYFKRCFALCIRPPTCSFDASGQRFSFILVPFPPYLQHVVHVS